MNQVLARRRDLGALDGPLMLFGGPYSNFQATEALFERASVLGIYGNRMICTGDVCAYCADPLETARLMMGSGAAVVSGNCEESLGARAEDCGCGFGEGAACDRFSAEWFRHADAALSDTERAWMLGCPGVITFCAYGRRYAVLHGSASAVNRFVWPVESDSVLESEIVLLEAAIGPVDGVVAGHTGMAFERRVTVGKRSVQWINAGAIGLPAHDGDPRTSYAVLGKDGVRFERLAYDHAAAAAAMRAAGLRAGYDRSLETGWWPSEDSFPSEMQLGKVA
jgi:hypothetical protein